MLLSLCMIVKDEENNLPRCLESVKDLVNEMIIVDTGSTDSTVKIAEDFGAKVYHFPWNGSFSDARNFSLKQASGDWIMVMDADDQLEKSGKQAVLDLLAVDDADAYFFETISYIGETPGVDILKNLNLRLLKNGKGYFYSNPIHEQIYCNIKAVNPSAKIINKNIKVYHYGYLNKNITEHNKRARNISLLEKELSEKPGYPFALFNLGSEYYAMGDNVKAIEYFEQAYRKFNIEEGFSSHLILKMVHCYLGLGRYDDALKLSSEGLTYFPGFTDLEYLKGIVQNTLGKYMSAIKHFKKCCEMGEAPSHLNVIIGTGSYRPYFMLGETYYDLEDHDSASENYINSLKHNSQFTIALSKLIRTYCKMKMGRKALKESIEDLRIYGIEKYESIIFNELLQEKYYDMALSYMEKYEKTYGISSFSLYNKGLCKLYLKKYSAAIKIMSQVKKDPEYYIRAVCIQSLCHMIENNISQAKKVLCINNADTSNIMLNVYMSFNTLLETGKVNILSNNEKESALYTPVIFDILKTLLTTYQFVSFEKALNMLNSINDKTVLLKLGKLYYCENCYGLAYQELIRSIKIFDYIDLEGSKILYKLKFKGL